MVPLRIPKTKASHLNFCNVSPFDVDSTFISSSSSIQSFSTASTRSTCVFPLPSMSSATSTQRLLWGPSSEWVKAIGRDRCLWPGGVSKWGLAWSSPSTSAARSAYENAARTAKAMTSLLALVARSSLFSFNGTSLLGSAAWSVTASPTVCRFLQSLVLSLFCLLRGSSPADWGAVCY